MLYIRVEKGMGERDRCLYERLCIFLGTWRPIFASMSFFDASTKFKPRILAPIYVSLLILLVVLGLWLWKKRREVVMVLVLLIFGLIDRLDSMRR